MNIALIGYGKMGKTIEQLAIEKGHTIVARTGKIGFNANDIAAADVCIEFTSPESGFENITKCIAAGKPVVSGTTGWLNRLDEVKNLVAAAKGSFFYASNFSLGVNLFWAVNEYLANIMNDYPDYDVAVHEIHHTHKKDAPSGTAITTAEQIVTRVAHKTSFALDADEKNVLKITAERVDPAPGTHIVKYTSAIDDIELHHIAHSRLGFAKGALLAAEWLPGKQGVFGMNDLLNLKKQK